jgi:xanthine phosphoribosyltransferase
MVCHHNLQI